jgi:hypothetical protein
MAECFSLYPEKEPEGWFRKASEAERWLDLVVANDTATMIAEIGKAANPIVTDPLSFDRCKFRLVFREACPNRVVTTDDIATVTNLCVKVMVNGEFFEEFYGDVCGHKTKLLADILTAETVAEYLAIDIDYTEVESLASRFG